jgi:hypothetical protein
LLTVTIDERRNRLAHRHFLSPSDSPAMTRIVAGLVGLHATDPATPYPSLWARADELTSWLDGARIISRFPSPLPKAGARSGELIANSTRRPRNPTRHFGHPMLASAAKLKSLRRPGVSPQTLKCRGETLLRR